MANLSTPILKKLFRKQLEEESPGEGIVDRIEGDVAVVETDDGIKHVPAQSLVEGQEIDPLTRAAADLPEQAPEREGIKVLDSPALRERQAGDEREGSAARTGPAAVVPMRDAEQNIVTKRDESGEKVPVGVRAIQTYTGPPGEQAPATPQSAARKATFDWDAPSSWGGGGGYNYEYIPGEGGPGTITVTHGGDEDTAPVNVTLDPQNPNDQKVYGAILGEHSRPGDTGPLHPVAPAASAPPAAKAAPDTPDTPASDPDGFATSERPDEFAASERPPAPDLVTEQVAATPAVSEQYPDELAPTNLDSMMARRQREAGTAASSGDLTRPPMGAKEQLGRAQARGARRAEAAFDAVANSPFFMSGDEYRAHKAEGLRETGRANRAKTARAQGRDSAAKVAAAHEEAPPPQSEVPLHSYAEDHPPAEAPQSEVPLHSYAEEGPTESLPLMEIAAQLGQLELPPEVSNDVTQGLFQLGSLPSDGEEYAALTTWLGRVAQQYGGA